MKRRDMRLNHIPEDDEIINCQLPDTPMFRHTNEKHSYNQLQEPSSCQAEMQSLKEIGIDNSSNSLQIHCFQSLDSNGLMRSSSRKRLQETSDKQMNLCHANSDGEKITNFTDTSSTNSFSRSKSTIQIGSAQKSEMQRLRRTNYINEKIITELSASVKQLQSKLSCYELSNNELRLQLLEKSGECETLKSFIQTIRYQHVEEHIVLKKQIMVLQDRLARHDFSNNLNLITENTDEQNKKQREIYVKSSLTESSVEDRNNHHGKPPSATSSFKLKSFRNSLSSLRNNESSSSVDNREKQNTFEDQTDRHKQQAIRLQLDKLECRVEHLGDQQKLLKFKNTLLQMKIK